MQVNHIGKTTTVIIAFGGDKVPNHRYGNLWVECSLNRKQIDMCYRCGPPATKWTFAQTQKTGYAVVVE